jgi:hypothetical protein
MGIDKLIDRAKYQAIKKFTFPQMVNFLTTLYTEGYKTATKDINKTVNVIDESKLEKGIKELIRKEFGIGEKRYRNADIEKKILDIIAACTSEAKIFEVDVKLKS